MGAVLVGLGIALVVAGAVAPGRLRPVYGAWMAMALAISKVTTPVLMGIVYFGMLTPIGLVMRLVGRRVLGRPAGAATYWVDRPAAARRSDLRRQF
jgi:saxitoxin biosynthesis operon SxtJ-like protein